MRKILKRAASLSICFILCFLFIGSGSAQAAGWPTTSNIKTYPISTSNDTIVYQTATSTARYGTIYASDLVTILGTSGDRLKVSYSIGGNKTKTGYVDKSAITPGSINVSTSSFQANGSITVYRRSSGSLTIGTITKCDNVFVIATSGSRSQVIYPLTTAGGGYKMGWVNTSSIPTVNPIGCVDSAVSTANNQVTVSGWVAFPSGTSGSSQSLSCHVYVGGPAGSGAPGYAISANQYRADVNKAVGISGNHGFSTTITVDSSKTGTQTLYFYGIGGSNPLIGTKTVTIKGNSSGSTTVSSAQSQITNRLNAMMSGSYGNGLYTVGTRYSGPYSSEQCKGFAKRITELLFGYNIGSTKSQPNNYQISISSNNTKLVGSLTSLSSKSDSTLRSLFSNARPGDFIQVRRSHGGSHSMIFLSADATSVTVYESNVDGNNGIQKATYSYATFRSSNAAVSVYTAVDYNLH